MGSKIKTSLFKYLVIALIISITLSIIVQSAAQTISDQLQLKYVNLSELYEFQNKYSQQFEDFPWVPVVSPEKMTLQDRVIKELCDFISSWSILFFTFAGVFIALTLFYKRRLKIPFQILNESAEKISRQDLDFKIEYNCNDELGQICVAYEKMRERLVDNNRLMWGMIDEQKQMRSAFSHDLRTPLTVMKGYVEYLLKYYPEDKLSREKIMEVLEELQSQTERISDFADTMKSINRLEEVSINRELVEIGIFGKRIESIMLVLAEKYGKQFEVRNEINEKQLNLDMDVFLEIFENLSDNAMRFATRLVTIELYYTTDRIIARVYDDGKGFQPNELEKAVKPFYHGENEGEEHYGMGLYICKMLCEKQDGFLQIYNPPGGGACVEFQVKA